MLISYGYAIASNDYVDPASQLDYDINLFNERSKWSACFFGRIFKILMPTRTGNRRLMREVNTKLILGHLRRCDALSQAELLKKTGLSVGTIANIVKELKEDGFVKEVGPGTSSIGRKPVQLRFNPCARHVVAIELSSGQTQVALVDLSGRIVVKTGRAIAVDVEPRAVLELACDDALALAKKEEIFPQKLLGVGISLEGIIDPNRELLVFWANQGWRNVPVKEILESKLGIPAVINNAGGAFGEYWYGAGKGSKVAVCMEVNSGIGASVLLGGRLLHGARGMAGEIGHSLAVPEGNLCSCGKRGCLETVASASAIIAEVLKKFRDAPDSLISPAIESCPLPKAIRQIGKAAADGDAIAQSVLEDAGRHLGIAAAAIINLLDPELLLLTGMVIHESRGIVLDVVRQAVAEHMFPERAQPVRIEQGILGNAASLTSAAAMVCEEVFRVPLESEL